MDAARPIDTAPQDDTDILTWSREIGFVISSYKDKPHRRGFMHRNGHCKATHWWPLPAEPADMYRLLTEALDALEEEVPANADEQVLIHDAISACKRLRGRYEK